MERKYKISAVEVYVPYSKAKSGIPCVGLTSSRQISMTDYVYTNWIRPARRVELSLVKLEEEGVGEKRAVGIRPLSPHDESGGLALTGSGKTKSRYIAAKGFLRFCKISREGNEYLDCFFDPSKKMVIAPLKSETAIQQEEAEKSIKSSRPSLKKAIREVLRPEQGPLRFRNICSKLKHQGMAVRNNTVWVALDQLVRKGRVKKPGRGLYLWVR